MDELKIPAEVKATDTVARELWMRSVASEPVKEGEIVKPVEYEDAYPKDASGIRPPIFVDDKGRPVTPWDFDARKRGCVSQVFEGVDVVPDPKSTLDNPLPPLAVTPYTKVFITGRAEAKAALAAKLTVARAADAAKAALLEAEPIEGEIVVEK